MKRLYALIVAAALCLPSVGALAWWQSIQQVGVGGGAPLPTLTYIGLAPATVSTNTATATGAAIGTAAANRLVVVILYDDGGNLFTSTLTINGVTATQIALFAGNGSAAGIYALNVTSGTTANIVATCSNTFSTTVFDVYTLTGLSSMTAVGGNATGSSSASTLTTTVATTSGGVVIAGINQHSNTSPTAVVTGTEAYTADHSNFAIGGFSSTTSAHASGVATNASSSVTGTWVGANIASMAAGSWR